jgi:hypothetical protein
MWLDRFVRVFTVFSIVTVIARAHAADLPGPLFTAPLPTAASEKALRDAAAGPKMTPAQEKYVVDSAAAAAVYAECMHSQAATWLIKPDLNKCATARAAYAVYLPADIADLVLACFDETATGTARATAPGCKALTTLLDTPPPTDPKASSAQTVPSAISPTDSGVAP